MKKKRMQVPKGNKFLPETSLQYLEECHKKERNPKAKLRLLACIMRKRGHTLVEITDSLEVKTPTLSTWLARIERDGIAARYDKKKTAKPGHMSVRTLEGIMEDLVQGPEKSGFETSVWTPSLIEEHVKNKYGYDCAGLFVGDLLRRTGLPKAAPPYARQAPEYEDGKAGWTQSCAKKGPGRAPRR